MPISIWRKLIGRKMEIGGNKLVLYVIQRMQPVPIEKKLVHFRGKRKSIGGSSKISQTLFSITRFLCQVNITIREIFSPPEGRFTVTKPVY